MKKNLYPTIVFMLVFIVFSCGSPRESKIEEAILTGRWVLVEGDTIKQGTRFLNDLKFYENNTVKCFYTGTDNLYSMRYGKMTSSWDYDDRKKTFALLDKTLKLHGVEPHRITLSDTIGHGNYTLLMLNNDIYDNVRGMKSTLIFPKTIERPKTE